MEMWNVEHLIKSLKSHLKKENQKQNYIIWKKDQDVCDTHIITRVGDCGQWDVCGDFGSALHTSPV